MTEPIRDTETAVRELGALPVPVGAQPPMTPEAARVRLAQYGERTKTWSTATYDSGTERALHEIAVTLLAEADALRARLAESERPVDEDPIRYTLTEQAEEASPAAFRIVVDLENADDYDDAVYAAEQAQGALRGQGYKNVAVVDTEGDRLKAQLEAVRAVHVKHADSEHCQHDGEQWPCPTVAALGETGGEA
ncbi:hypothetical protein [Streptomyces massasporeus]|uniref:hypothetical protein n=1 Tax=Streptomyces massasporeus TaxID=67324 RepID=UPI00381F76F1